MKDLRDQFEDNLKEHLFEIGGKTLEEALEEALDQTTPETPGDPRDNQGPRLKENSTSEWI